MDYVRKFLHVEGVIGQGAFGRVLLTSPLQNQQQVTVIGGDCGIQQPQSQPNHLPTDIAIGNNNNEHHQRRHSLDQLQLECPKVSPPPKQDKNTANNNTRLALKCVHPILKPQRLASELRYLRDLGGQCNVVQMHTAYFNMGSLFIVMELIEHDRFTDIVTQLNYEEIVIYMKNLLIALEHVHARNIMHRDIKPANFLFNRKHRKFLLVDFGLAQVSRTGLFGAKRTTNAPTNVSSSIQHSTIVNSSPKTPTSLNKRPINTPLFSNLHHDNRIEKLNQFEAHPPLIPNSPFVNPKPNLVFNRSPARHQYMNLTPAGSPSTPNLSTKRHLPAETNDFNQMLKKLRVSNTDEIREPVKLTVGAYESPVTHNDNSTRARNNINDSHKFSTPKIPRRSASSRCDCRGKPKTCTVCLSRPDSSAPKSGTPGFKAPEILLRYIHQTTAIDIWSAGVIFACLLSGHSPFFRDIEDTVSLGEIITIFGSQRIIQAARALGIRLDVEPKREPVDLKNLCKTIRFNNKDKLQIDIPDAAFELLERMLDPNPLTRITASDALKHAWFNPSTEV